MDFSLIGHPSRLESLHCGTTSFDFNLLKPSFAYDLSINSGVDVIFTQTDFDPVGVEPAVLKDVVLSTLKDAHKDESGSPTSVLVVVDVTAIVAILGSATRRTVRLDSVAFDGDRVTRVFTRRSADRRLTTATALGSPSRSEGTLGNTEVEPQSHRAALEGASISEETLKTEASSLATEPVATENAAESLLPTLWFDRETVARELEKIHEGDPETGHLKETADHRTKDGTEVVGSLEMVATVYRDIYKMMADRIVKALET